jgi:hypothetical protein
MASHSPDTLLEHPGQHDVAPVQSPSRGAEPPGPDDHNQSEVAEADEDLIEWGVLIDAPPPRPERIIKVQFVEGGQRPILISQDPRD